MGALTSIIQPSFSAGELSPSLYGRVDLAKYRSGASQMRNWFVMPYGGAATRPGTAIVGRCKQPYGTKPRNIPFEFNTLQTYILEFGQEYMRVIKDGGYVLEPGKSIVGVTKTNPGVFNIAAHGWSVGDQIFISGSLGMTQVNSTPGYQYIVDTVPDAAHVTFTDLDGNVVDTSGFGTYTGSGIAARLFTLVTPYDAEDLPLLKYVQSADVMTLTHPDYASANLTRTDHYVWTITDIDFEADVQDPAGSAAAVPGGGTDLDFWYVVTALTDYPAEESIPSAPFMVTNDALNQDTGINNTITITPPGSGPTPDRYNVYRSRAIAASEPQPTVFGYIGQTTDVSFVDANYAPDFSLGPPNHSDPFAGGNNPACSAYHQGRHWFAGASALPQTANASQIENFNNFDVHSPIREDDAITVTLVSRQVNAIKHLVSTTSLIALTSGGAWLISSGGQSDAITPTNISAKPQSFNGSSDVPPLTIGPDVLYVQGRGSKPRNLTYDFYTNIFAGHDLSVLSSHFFFGFQMQEWCYNEDPFYQVLGVRDDGACLAFTYLKEQDVYGWSKYDSLGDSMTDKFRSIASIPEGQENSPYAIVERTIPGVNGGEPVYYQERFASRNFYVEGVADVRLAWCVDAGMQFTGTGQTVLSGMQHLEGATVSMLVNGSTQPPQEVVDGSITLQSALETGQIATVGLPYVCDLKTLRLDLGEPTVQGKYKKVSRLNLMLDASRGLAVSPARQLSNGLTVFDQYKEIKERSTQPYGSPIELFTGLESIIMTPQWQLDGMIGIRQSYPLPATVLAIAPWISVGSDGG